MEPSRLANGVIVVGPKSEIDGIRELLTQADPNDRDFLIANKALLPKGVVSEEELGAELPNGFYTEARKNAEERAGGERVNLAAKGESTELVQPEDARDTESDVAAASESAELV